MIWFLKLAILLGGKNLAKKAFFVSSSHVEIDLGGKECSHALALSLDENGNRRKRAVVDAPFIFTVSHTSRNTERYRLRSSIGEPPN